MSEGRQEEPVKRQGALPLPLRVCVGTLVLLATFGFGRCGGGLAFFDNSRADSPAVDRNKTIQPPSRGTHRNLQFAKAASVGSQFQGVPVLGTRVPGADASRSENSTESSSGLTACSECVDPPRLIGGVVKTDPVGDQTIRGAHALILSDPGSTFQAMGMIEIGPGELALDQHFFNNYYGANPTLRTTTRGATGDSRSGYLVGTASELEDDGNGVAIGLYSTVLQSNTVDSSNGLVIGVESDVYPNPAAGVKTTATSGFNAGMDFSGPGTITTMAGYSETSVSTGGGIVHRSLGFAAGQHGKVGDTLNAAFYSPDQGTGHRDYAIYIEGGRNNLGPQPTSVGSLVISRSHTPSSPFDVCTPGTITWDSDFFYVCIAKNTWRRAPLSW